MSRVPDLAERLLFQEAVTVADHAYAPYSGFHVGAFGDQYFVIINSADF